MQPRVQNSEGGLVASGSPVAHPHPLPCRPWSRRVTLARPKPGYRLITPRSLLPLLYPSAQPPATDC